MAHGLAQQAREKQLKTARVILIIVGVLTIAANGFFFSRAETEVEEAFDAEATKQYGAGYDITDKELWESEKAKVLKLTRLMYGGGIVLGVIFISGTGILYSSWTFFVISTGVGRFFHNRRPRDVAGGCYCGGGSWRRRRRFFVRWRRRQRRTGHPRYAETSVEQLAGTDRMPRRQRRFGDDGKYQSYVVD